MAATEESVGRVGRLRQKARMGKRGRSGSYPGITAIEGGYVVRVTHEANGRAVERERRLLGVTLTQAIMAREQLRQEICKPQPENETMAAYIGRWLNHHRVTERSREYTLVRWEQLANQWIVPLLGAKTLREIKSSDLAGWMEWVGKQRRTNGMPYAEKTLLNVWSLMQGLWSDAKLLANLEARPDQGLRLSLPKVALPPVARGSLTGEELMRLLPRVRDLEAERAVEFWLLAGLGVRWSEAAGFIWSDVDWTNGLLRISRTRVRGTYGRPKTAQSRRVLPLVPPLRRALLSLLETEGKTTETVEPGEPIVRVQQPSTLQRRLDSITAEAGVTVRVTPHVFRHTLSNLVRKESSSVEAKALLGHVTDAQHERYSKVRLEELVAILGKVWGD